MAFQCVFILVSNQTCNPMVSDSDSIKGLANSIACLSALMASSRYTVRATEVLRLDSCADAARWAAIVTLLAGGYYLQFNVWRRCRRRRHRGPAVEPAAQVIYTDVPQTPPPSEAGAAEPSGQQLTASHVYVYVYGWGILLFASLYCMAGLHESSSCWWALGMFPLCFDELIMRETKRRWVVVLGCLLACTVVALWWRAGGERAKDESIALILLGTVVPVMSPFIFFSLRSSVRAVTKDILRLCELALPFMLLISICVLTGGFMSDGERWGAGSMRNARSLAAMNETVLFAETQSEFDFNRSTHTGHNTTSTLKERELEAASRFFLLVLLALTPLIAVYCILVMVWSVLHGYVTEFITVFLLVLSVKSSIVGDQSGGSAFAIASAGTCFILIFLMRKVI